MYIIFSNTLFFLLFPPFSPIMLAHCLLYLYLQSKKPENISISSTGKYFGIHEKRKLRIWEVPTKDNKNINHRKLRLSHTKDVTCVAFHPTDRIVAAGDVTGRILIWRGFGDRTFVGDNGRFLKNDDDEENPGVRGDGDADSCTTWHWHSAEVKVLFFSSDGAYLYSGKDYLNLSKWPFYPSL